MDLGPIDREDVECATNLMREGIAACGLPGCTVCVRGAQVLSFLEYRLAREEVGSLGDVVARGNSIGRR